MKRKVKFSIFCKGITAVVYAVLVAAIWNEYGKGNEWLWILLIGAALTLFGLYYAPTSVEAAEEAVKLRRPLATKSIPYEDIASVETCYPSPGGLRLCASGGFMGYWGYFTDIVIGNYFGYYGRADQAFLITTHAGNKYVLSCDDRDAMVTAIGRRIEAI